MEICTTQSLEFICRVSGKHWLLKIKKEKNKTLFVLDSAQPLQDHLTPPSPDAFRRWISKPVLLMVTVSRGRPGVHTAERPTGVAPVWSPGASASNQPRARRPGAPLLQVLMSLSKTGMPTQLTHELVTWAE